MFSLASAATMYCGSPVLFLVLVNPITDGGGGLIIFRGLPPPAHVPNDNAVTDLNVTYLFKVWLI